MKRCSVCRKRRWIDEFRRRRAGCDWPRASECDACHAARQRLRRRVALRDGFVRHVLGDADLSTRRQSMKALWMLYRQLDGIDGFVQAWADYRGWQQKRQPGETMRMLQAALDLWKPESARRQDSF